MILCLPYHASLPCDFKKLVSHLKSKGSHPSHSLMIVCNHRHEEAAFSVAMGLTKLFARQEMVIIPDEEQETMLRASNRLFKAAMKAFHDYKSQPPEHPNPAMCYYDPTYRPVINRWLDGLQSDYYLQGGPTVMARFADEITVGPVVFGPQFPRQSKLIDFVPDTIHWRRYLASEIVNFGVGTGIIGDDAESYIRPYNPEK